MSGPPGLIVTSRPGLLVVALRERRVVAGELRLRHPLELERDLRRLRRAAARDAVPSRRPARDARAATSAPTTDPSSCTSPFVCLPWPSAILTASRRITSPASTGASGATTRSASARRGRSAIPSSEASRIPAQASRSGRSGASELISTPSALNDAAEVLADDGADHREHARDLQRGEDERQRGRDPHAPPDLELAGGVGAHQLDLARARALQPAERVDDHREEAEDRGDRHLRGGESGSNHSFEDRREGDDRDGVRRDRDRHERRAERSGSGRRASPRGSPSAEPIAKPPSASLNVYQPAGQSSCRSVAERRRDRRSAAGSRNCWMWKSGDRALPGDDARARRRRARGSPLAEPLAARRRSLERRSSSGSRCSPRSAQQLAHLGDELEEARLLARLDAVRGCGRSIVDDPGDPARAAGYITTTRVERKTASEIECVTKTTVEPSSLPDREQLEVQALARHLVERAERLVHQQQRRLERQRARDRRRAAACRRRAATDGGRRSPSARRARASPRTRCPAPLAVPAEHLERQRDVLRDRAPVEEHRVLEHDPVVAVDARLPRRLAVDRHRARASAGSGRRSCAAASTCRSPRGRSARRTRPARSRGRCPAARYVPAPNASSRPRSRRPVLSAHATFSGARRTTSFSASTTTRKNEIPSSAATMFVAQSSCGSSE